MDRYPVRSSSAGEARLASLAALVAALGGACGDRATTDKPAAPPASTPARSIDAGVTTVPAFDPSSDYHYDPDVAAPRPSARAGSRDRKPVQLLLRSSPGGAFAAVDGYAVGLTPVVWEGDANGGSHDFTFRLPGHSVARYRFVPLTDGIVHATLVRIPEELPTELPVPPPAAPATRAAPRPAPVEIAVDAGVAVDADGPGLVPPVAPVP